MAITGIISFIQLIKIEFEQGYELIVGWQGIDQYIDGTGLNAIINLVVEMFVQQFQSFGQAISWPGHFFSSYTVLECFAFIAITYGAFSLTRTFAWKAYTKAQ